MARVQGQIFHVVSWDKDWFYVKVPMTSSQIYKVHPLNILLHDHEMLAWSKAPAQMDKEYEHDLMRPGKLKKRSFTGRT